ncbi:MAG: DUF2911 domain-containing protein [Cyclobacteriaceae bacterium]
MKKQVYFKVIAFTMLICAASFVAQAQKDKSKRPSPPAQATATVDGTTVTIDYSQPSLKGRDLFKLTESGKVWRTGANEAAWIEVSDDVKVNGKTLKKGKYGFFTINNKSDWTIIFNEVWDQWGAYDYDPSKDVLRVTADAKTGDTSVEKFTIDIDDSGKTSLKWGATVVEFSISK